MHAKSVYITLALFIGVLLVVSSRTLGQSDISVSLIRLIANPEKYDGQAVSVIGYLRLEFEGNMIYLHKEDFDHRVSENAVRVGIKKNERAQFKKKDLHYVLIVGTFQAAKSGTSDPNGTIVNISKIEIWPFGEQSVP